jgi:hypothetical protein
MNHARKYRVDAPRHDAELLALPAEFRADFNAWSAAVDDLAADVDAFPVHDHEIAFATARRGGVA